MSGEEAVWAHVTNKEMGTRYEYRIQKVRK